MLQTVAKMQNDVGMTPQIDCFRFISVFGNNFTKIRCKFDEKTSLSGKLVYKKNHFSRLVLSASFEKSFVKQTQSIVSDIITCC